MVKKRQNSQMKDNNVVRNSINCSPSFYPYQSSVTFRTKQDVTSDGAMCTVNPIICSYSARNINESGVLHGSSSTNTRQRSHIEHLKWQLKNILCSDQHKLNTEYYSHSHNSEYHSQNTECTSELYLPVFVRAVTPVSDKNLPECVTGKCMCLHRSQRKKEEKKVFFSDIGSTTVSEYSSSCPSSSKGRSTVRFMQE